MEWVIAMRSIDVANLLIDKYASQMRITNLTLNKYVYFAQVESLKKNIQKPLFSDDIEAWQYGPVEPLVYRAFKQYGRQPIGHPEGPLITSDNPGYEYAIMNIDAVIRKYGSLTAFDLVSYTHRPGGAWAKVYDSQHAKRITVTDIINSDDCKTEIDLSRTLHASVQNVERQWPNALRMLGDA